MDSIIKNQRKSSGDDAICKALSDSCSDKMQTRHDAAHVCHVVTELTTHLPHALLHMTAAAGALLLICPAIRATCYSYVNLTPPYVAIYKRRVTTVFRHSVVLGKHQRSK